MEVRGAHHFPPTQPYVVVSNHQSSLDLLGEASGPSPLAEPPLLAPPTPAFPSSSSSLPLLGRVCVYVGGSLGWVWCLLPRCLGPDPSPTPPHQGMMEVLPDRCVPIAKRELLWAGSAGLACWLAGVIFIDRKRTGDAISVMSEVAQTLLTQDVSLPQLGFGDIHSQ